MIKKSLLWGVPAFVVLVILFLIKFDTNIYLSFEGGEELFSVNSTVKVDNVIIFDDILLSPEWSGINVKIKNIPMRMGFHKIEAFSDTQKDVFKKRVFILFNHYIMVTYWEGRDNFTVRTGFNPFLFM